MGRATALRLAGLGYDVEAQEMVAEVMRAAFVLGEVALDGRVCVGEMGLELGGEDELQGIVKGDEALIKDQRRRRGG